MLLVMLRIPGTDFLLLDSMRKRMTEFLDSENAMLKLDGFSERAVRNMFPSPLSQS